LNKAPHVRRNTLRLLWLVLLIGMTGCSEQQKLYTALKAYQHRMASVLEVPSPVVPTVGLAAYPSIKTLNRNIPSAHIPLAEFYQLKNCQLATLVAQRNTPLGRTQYPSTRYLYEVELLQAIEPCLNNQDDQPLTGTLRNWQADKQQKLPLAWANLLQTSSEVKQALSANQGFIQGNEQDGLNQTLAALHYLEKLRTEPTANRDMLENHLANLQQYQLPARLWRSQMLLGASLEQTTRWLVRNEKLIQCPKGRTSKTAEYLSNVFQLFFIQKIQAIAGKLNAYHYQLAPLLTQLTTHPQIHPSFSGLILAHLIEGFTTYKTAMDNHIRFWQGLYQRCGLNPGR
jgi:hypothetical protein